MKIKSRGMTRMPEKEDVKRMIEKLGYKIVYVPHEVIENYNACYRVIYRGRIISPPAAEKLGIPLNEIWISHKLKDFDQHILYHELREIEHRSRGHDAEQAHKLANKDVKEKFRGDPKHERLLREINIASKEILMELAGINQDLFQEIKENRPYHEIDELIEKIPSMERQIFERIRKHFWCIS